MTSPNTESDKSIGGDKPSKEGDKVIKKGDKSIDEWLDSFGLWCILMVANELGWREKVLKQMGKTEEDATDFDSAKDQLYSLLMDVIGETEHSVSISKNDLNNLEAINIANNRVTSCNQLRAKQRQKLIQLFGKET